MSEQDRQEFLDLGARVRRALAVEQRRTAKVLAEAITRRTTEGQPYTAAQHAFVMQDVDRELDRLYGAAPDDGTGAFLRLIVRHARSAWRERLDRLALVGGGLREQGSDDNGSDDR